MTFLENLATMRALLPSYKKVELSSESENEITLVTKITLCQESDDLRE